jgi:hypothetical protein
MSRALVLTIICYHFYTAIFKGISFLKEQTQGGPLILGGVWGHLVECLCLAFDYISLTLISNLNYFSPSLHNFTIT